LPDWLRLFEFSAVDLEELRLRQKRSKNPVNSKHYWGQFGLLSAVLSLVKLSVPFARIQNLALANAGVGSTDSVSTLSDESLRECVGAAAVACLRPQREATAS
jgi:hypothetical protein